jgi:hypothetical protein
MSATIQQRIAGALCRDEAGVKSMRADRKSLYPQRYPQVFPLANFPAGVRIGPARRLKGMEGDDLP